MISKYKDVISGAALLALGVLLFATSFSIPRGAEMGVGAGFMPKLMSILLAIAGLVMVVQGKAAAVQAKDKAAEIDGANYKAVVLSLVYLGLFVALLSRLGFVITTFAYIFFQTILFCPVDRRNYKIITLVAVVATALIYIIFAKGFKLLLPAGILG